MPEKRVPVTPGEVTMSATAPETRGDRLLDGLRLTVLGVLATVGLSVGFGVGDGWTGAIAGVASVVGLVLGFKVPPVRNVLARLVDWTIGR